MDDYANYHCFGFNPEKFNNKEEEEEENNNMATRKKTEYVSKTLSTKITASSRCAVKIRDNYYTIEASEERSITDSDNADMDKEWALLFDSVNKVVDTQIEDIIKEFTKKR